MQKKKLLALMLIAALTAGEIPDLPMMAGSVSLSAPRASAESLEDKRDSYENQAEKKRKKSAEIEGHIASLSEQKRQIDEEADTAEQAYKEVKSRLDETRSRIADNKEKIDQLSSDRDEKRKLLKKRVRDIYINGQISYLDVLFGAKDMQDFLTRMDLLKRVIKYDYDLVKTVMDEMKEIESAQKELDKDQEELEPQVQDAEDKKDVMLLKKRKQQKLIDKMKNDKATLDRQYDELMAASKEITKMIQQRQGGYAYDSGSYSGGNGSMSWPISGPITSPFGWRVHPITGTQKFHSGVDIGADYGVPIHAAQSGTVEYAGWVSGYGNTVIINHGGGITTLYGHNQSLAVSAGQSVSQGQVISYCGSTGNSTGPHCHFEVRQNGEPVSPYSYL